MPITNNLQLRNQLYPLGKGNYPTLVQKHFNGADTGLVFNFLCVIFMSMQRTKQGMRTHGMFVSWVKLWCGEEAAVLAHFLKGVTLAAAHMEPANEHNAFLGVF